MRLTYITQAEAQAVADRIHDDLIETDALYAKSVELGHTKRWAVPYQDMDKDGKPLNGLWHVTIDERCRGVLTEAERTAVPEWQEKQP